MAFADLDLRPIGSREESNRGDRRTAQAMSRKAKASEAKQHHRPGRRFGNDARREIDDCASARRRVHAGKIDIEVPAQDKHIYGDDRARTVSGFLRRFVFRVACAFPTRPGSAHGGLERIFRQNGPRFQPVQLSRGMAFAPVLFRFAKSSRHGDHAVAGGESGRRNLLRFVAHCSTSLLALDRPFAHGVRPRLFPTAREHCGAVNLGGQRTSCS